jgi:hypothetical protein
MRERGDRHTPVPAKGFGCLGDSMSPCPTARVPRVAGIGEFALCKGHRYATVLIDAATGEQFEVLPDRRAVTVTAWLRAYPATGETEG